MERGPLILSTLFFLAGFAQSMFALGARMRGVSRWYFLSIVGGFGFQIAWLAERGEVLRRCPLTSSFDVLVFIAWSMVLFYLVIGPVYRVSLLGLFTAPAAFILQTVALLMGVPALGEIRPATSGLLELHAAISVMAYGGLGLAALAGAMYLLQERQLKTRQLSSFFFSLPPVRDLTAAMRRLLIAGFVLLSAGLGTGIASGPAHRPVVRWMSVAMWLLYGAVAFAVGVRKVDPVRVAYAAIGAFIVLLVTVGLVELALP
jgi:ABC-type uncharacterized transport system permease subunit